MSELPSLFPPRYPLWILGGGLPLLSACSESSLWWRQPHQTFDTADSGQVLQFNPLNERCDGLDNDFDGLVDEGFADRDGDGVRDCLDGSCGLTLRQEEAVAQETGCVAPEFTPSADPWAIRKLWQAPALSEGCTIGTIAVDADGDGITDVLCDDGQALRAYSGDDGHVLWSLPDVLSVQAPLAAADLDNDGAMEIASMDRSCRAISIELDGTVAWLVDDDVLCLNDVHVSGYNRMLVDVADLTADGGIDVLFPDAVVTAADGRLQFQLAPLELSYYQSLNGVAAVDLDQAGPMEILARRVLHGYDGTPLWTSPSQEPGLGWDCAAALALQVDDDDQGEVAIVASNGLWILDTDGTVLSQRPFDPADNTCSEACAGDIDGDGRPEIIFPDKHQLMAYRVDTSLLWALPNDETSTGGATGCTTFDFDLDGAKEVLYGDEQDFYILDGRTGNVRFHDPARASLTVWDVPLVVDLDGDGSVEIVMTNWSGASMGDSALTVYTHARGEWPPGMRIWPSATWSGTSLFPDGTVPRTPEAPWLTTKVWRGQPELPILGRDLAVEVTDSCFSSCDPDLGSVALAVRIVNRGPEEVQGELPLTVYDSVTGDVLQVLQFGDFVDNGWASAAQEVVLTLERAKHGVLLVSEDEGDHIWHTEDCYASDNVLEWRLENCDE